MLLRAGRCKSCQATPRFSQSDAKSPRQDTLPSDVKSPGRMLCAFGLPPAWMPGYRWRGRGFCRAYGLAMSCQGRIDPFFHLHRRIVAQLGEYASSWTIMTTVPSARCDRI